MHTWLIFLRPRQWPILTCQLAVGVLAAPAAVAGLRAGRAPDAAVLAVAWAAWVVALNGGTLAFNSAYDRDTDSVAYLRRPPPPPPGLARRALLLMAGGALLGAVVAPGFAAVTAVCVLLSLIYSHPAVRLKGVAGADLAVNMLGYGAGTTLAGFFAGQAAWGAANATPDGATWRLAAGFGLLFGSFYPLTQIYQIAPDRLRGDRTLAVRLGPQRALLLALALGVAAAPGFLGAAARWPDAGATGRPVPWLAFGMGLWLFHLAVWLARADRLSARQQEAGMYRALALWALVDATVLAQRFLVGSGDGAAR